MKKKTVLIVDDDSLICRQLASDLHRGFYNTATASDGRTALACVREEDIDIILMDINLPDLNGLDVIKEVKSIRPNCEIIVITGYGTQEVAIQSLRSGAIDYIEKPINFEELHAALGRAQEKLSEKEEYDARSTLLIIDDDELVVKRLSSFFEKEGFEVFTAGSGSQGLEIVNKSKVDVIISDIQMDDMDGIEVLQKAKKQYNDIEGIMVTGHKENELAIKALRAGAIDYITKPVDLDELLLSVTRAIERIKLKRTRLYRNRELKISSEIVSKMNEELERRIYERSREFDQVQAQLFQTSKLATLGEMSAGMAHEMNQPLGGIALVAKNMSKLLDIGKLSQKDIEEGLKDIEASVKRMSRIINHIRTFSRQDAFKFTMVDVASTLDSAFSLLDEQLRIHGIEVVKDYGSPLPNINGEPYQLEQVWINLITNARDAMDEKEKRADAGRTPDLTTDKIDAPDYVKRLRVSVRRDPADRAVTVEVTDNGMGISPEIKGKVLDPFFTTKEVGQASGLGLSISYGIIKNHKGKIVIDSVKGEWTTVSVVLPEGEET
jgi:YesN/AraC family two-component response regulator